jgi:hypothetical protein
MLATFVDLESGRWHRTIRSMLDSAVLELIHVANPSNRMRVPLPENWRSFDEHQLLAYARRPEVRLWEDEDGLLWRVSMVGPDTPFPYPLNSRHLVFDSESAFAGIVRFTGECELGDLTDLDLRTLRNRISDFGGRRRAYRGPGGAG